MLPLREMQVRSPVGELRSHTPRGQKRERKRKLRSSIFLDPQPRPVTLAPETVRWVWDPSVSSHLPAGSRWISSSLHFFSFIFISWRLITLKYCSGFCHTLTWISHGFTCVPHPDPPSRLPPHPIPLGLKATQPQLAFYSEMLVGSLQHSSKDAKYFLFRTSYLSWLFQAGQADDLIL